MINEFKIIGVLQSMTRALILIFAVLFTGCSLLSPVAKDPVKRDKAVKKVEVPKVESKEKETKIAVRETPKKPSSDKLAFTLSDIDFSEKNNGLLITISYSGDDPKENIHTFFSGDNFFNMSFYKGSFTKSVKNKIMSSAIIGSVKFFEFKDSVQITVRLRKNYNSTVVSTDNNKITVSVFN
jgi:hypothetical protein